MFKSKDSPVAEILIRRTRKGCPLVVSRIELELSSIYGPHWLDSSRDSANVVIRDQLEEQYKGSFNEAGESTFRGQCQWLFRTSGRPRVLRKILDCKKPTHRATLETIGLFRRTPLTNCREKRCG